MEDDIRQITLVGQGKSGKTNLLATLLFNPNALDDLTLGPGGISAPALRGTAESGTSDEENIDYLSVHHNAILCGRDGNLYGTDQVRRYPLVLEFDSPNRDAGGKPGFFGFGSRPLGQMNGRSVFPFSIVDGRGGDIAPSEFIDRNDPENQERLGRQQDYRDGLDNSVGMVICMPILDKDFIAQIADRLVNEIAAAIERKKKDSTLPALKHVALVFTKYDVIFSGEGAHAGLIAANKEDAIEQLSHQAMLKKFAPVFRESARDGGYQTRIFPASTFGFVEKVGPANFYDYNYAPGLLSRAVDPDVDYTDPEINPDVDSVAGFKDHFPSGLSEQAASSLWHPFNIAPPILYALTGIETGPLLLRPEDLM